LRGPVAVMEVGEDDDSYGVIVSTDVDIVRTVSIPT